MTDPFVLDPRLEADSVPVASLALCDLRLMDDRRFPWALLVPRIAGAAELFDLSGPDRAVLVEEIAAVSRAMKSLSEAHKINVGALGNIVPQLHVHVVARHVGDAAWPGPVWGAGERLPHPPGEAAGAASRLAAAVAPR